MKKHLLSLAIIAGVFASSCKKDNTLDDVVNKSIDEITAPAGFNWSGSRDINLSIGISDNNFGNRLHVIKIYNADPAKGGVLVSAGTANLIRPFNTKIALSSLISEVFVEKVAPTGAVVTQTLQLTSNTVSTSIGESGAVASAKLPAGSIKKLSVTAEPNPTVPANATLITSANWESRPSGTYVIRSGGNYNFNSFTGTATLYVDGTGINIGNIPFSSNLTVIVTNGSTATFGNMNWTGSNTFKNFGTATLTSNLQPVGGVVRNQGTLTINGDFSPSNNTTVSNTSKITVDKNLNIGSSFETSGELTAKDGIAISSGSTLTNSGTVTFTRTDRNTTLGGKIVNTGTMAISSAEVEFNGNNASIENAGTFNALNARVLVKGSFVNNGTVRIEELHHNSGSIVNNCKWFITSPTFKNEINGTIENNSYFSVAKAININSGGKITLRNGALFVTKSIYDGFNEKIVGSGSTSVLKITEQIPNLQNHQNSAKFSGALQVVYTSGTLPQGMFENGAAQKAANETVYIATGECMEEGSGVAPVDNDPDDDGVEGDEDLFPNDPTRALRFYSDNFNNGGYTLAFEDKWPLKGDYDLNDVVVRYKYEYVISGDNKVVDIKATYVLLASGGDFTNGFGVEFPVPANKMTLLGSTITPAAEKSDIRLEDGQTNAVLILFNNSREQQLTWNTQNGVASSPAVTFEVNLHIDGGMEQSNLGTSVYNPFIFNMSTGYGRGFETHLFGKTPTSKANTAIFGTGDDRTGSGKYYATENNLPWAINIASASFVYPLETTPITEGYLQFANWATSGGASSNDWYKNTSGGYRDNSKLYIK